jgi:hypothetical protein
MFELYNTVTQKVAYTAKSYGDCRRYGIQKRIIRIEKGKFFLHVILGDWDIRKVK